VHGDVGNATSIEPGPLVELLEDTTAIPGALGAAHPTDAPDATSVIANRICFAHAMPRPYCLPMTAACVFCAIARGEAKAELVLEDETCVAFLDVKPLFHGHVLVVPRAHVVTLPDLPAGSVGPFFTRVQEIARAIPAALGAQGTFVAMNNVVSQSVPHLHAHVVPRTKGDGLKGFFWPRHKYESPEAMAAVADKIRRELSG
jgi:histidine triad (HIT) family protein